MVHQDGACGIECVLTTACSISPVDVEPGVQTFYSEHFQRPTRCLLGRVRVVLIGAYVEDAVLHVSRRHVRNLRNALSEYVAYIGDETTIAYSQDVRRHRVHTFGWILVKSSLAAENELRMPMSSTDCRQYHKRTCSAILLLQQLECFRGYIMHDAQSCLLCKSRSNNIVTRKYGSM